MLALRTRRAESEQGSAEDLVFCSLAGTSLDPDNLRTWVLKPVAQEIGAPWAAFHMDGEHAPALDLMRELRTPQARAAA